MYFQKKTRRVLPQQLTTNSTIFKSDINRNLILIRYIQTIYYKYCLYVKIDLATNKIVLDYILII